MPTYEYTCPACGRTFERQMSLSQHSAEATCPSCGAIATQRVGAGVTVLSGRSGFKKAPAEGCGGRPTCGEESPCCERGLACDGGDD